MKTVKYLMLLMSLVATSAKSEVIDVNHIDTVITNRTKGTANKICHKYGFLKATSGALITGLTTAKVKPIKVIQQESADGSYPERYVSVTFSLTASTAPALAGVYDFCITPSGFTWDNRRVQVEALLLGATAADNVFFDDDF